MHVDTDSAATKKNHESVNEGIPLLVEMPSPDTEVDNAIDVLDDTILENTLTFITGMASHSRGEVGSIIKIKETKTDSFEHDSAGAHIHTTYEVVGNSVGAIHHGDVTSSWAMATE